MQTLWLVGGKSIDLQDGEARALSYGFDDGRIAAVGTAPGGAQSIDAAGLYLTPGLIDAHVHLGISSPIEAHFGFQISPAQIAADIFTSASATIDAGFTTVRDCGGIDAGVVEVIEGGSVRGPRVISCGPVHSQLGGHGYYGARWEPNDMWETHHIPGLCALSLMAGNADELRRNVREGFSRGAKFVKLCVTGGVVGGHDKLTDTQFTVAEIAVAVEEAKARGTYVTVHAHNAQGVQNAVHAGAKCVEHGTGIDEETAALMSQHGVAHVPTFAVVEQLTHRSDDAGLSPAVRAKLGDVQNQMAGAMKISRAHGLKIGLGSDLIGPDQGRRGDELRIRAELEDALTALTSATVTNAEILGIADEVGALEVGKRADIVAWRENPLENPKVFADPDNAVLVIKNGDVVKDIR